MKLLLFNVNDKQYAAQLSQVYQVIAIPSITSVPESQDFVEGVINFAGKVVPLVNFKKKFLMADNTISLTDWVLIADLGNHYVGIVVDRVFPAVSFKDSDITKPDEILKEVKYLNAVAKIKDNLVPIVDFQLMLSAEDKQGLMTISEDSNFSSLPDSSEEDYFKEKVRVLRFKLDNECYCISQKEAKEVVITNNISKVPNAPSIIMGVINLRGEIIPVINIRHLLGFETKVKQEEFGIIVTDIKDELISVLVDEIQGTLELEEEDLQPTLTTIKGRLNEFTKGEFQVNDDILIYLSLNRILDCQEIINLRKGDTDA